MNAFIAKRLLSTTRVHFTSKLWKVEVSRSREALTFESAVNGESLKFPSVWLRDNCQCSECYDKALHSRLTPYRQFKGRILPLSATCLESKGEEVRFRVEWPDQHESVYELEWLREYDFSAEAQKRWLQFYHFEKLTWNAENFRKILRYFSYESLISSDLELLRWLVALNRRGIAIVENGGTDESQVEKLSARMGFLKKTTYGNLYRVEAKPDATNAAYLPTPLELHIDLPYYEYCPSFNVLHFTLQAKNQKEGENQLVDAFELCHQIKRFDKSMYDTLCETVVDWTDIGKDEGNEFHHIHRAPVICVNGEGYITRVNFSQHQRDAHFCGSIERANKWYQAMNHFVRLAHDPKNQISLKMNEGDMLTFDNLRVLHGRSAFKGSRCVIGGYFDADIVNSTIRVLLSKLKLSLDDID